MSCCKKCDFKDPLPIFFCYTVVYIYIYIFTVHLDFCCWICDVKIHLNVQIQTYFLYNHPTYKNTKKLNVSEIYIKHVCGKPVITYKYCTCHLEQLLLVHLLHFLFTVVIVFWTIKVLSTVSSFSYLGCNGVSNIAITSTNQWCAYI